MLDKRIKTYKTHVRSTWDRVFNPFWGVPYVGVNNAETWMIAAHNSKTTVDGEDSYAAHMLDLQVTDGLVSMIIVYSRDLPPPPPAQD